MVEETFGGVSSLPKLRALGMLLPAGIQPYQLFRQLADDHSGTITKGDPQQEISNDIRQRAMSTTCITTLALPPLIGVQFHPRTNKTLKRTCTLHVLP